MKLNKEDNMADKDFEKYMEEKRKCKGYYFDDRANVYKYFAQIQHKKIQYENTIIISFLNGEDAKWAYLEFYKVLYKEGYEKAVSWISSHNEEYKKRILDKYIDELECKWRYIDNCDNNYIVTEDGTVYSLFNFYLNKLKPDSSRSYHRYTIMTNKGKGRFFAHSLVANAFLEKPDKKNLVVDHIDRDKLNNHYSNLRWISPRQNRVNSDQIDNAKGYYKTGKTYRAIISFLGSFVYKSFSNEKDAYNFSKKHRTKINSLSECEAIDYLENLKLEIKKERFKVSKGFSKRRNRYTSCITYNKKNIYLGCFKTEKEARQAYLDAVEKYHGIKIEE